MLYAYLTFVRLIPHGPAATLKLFLLSYIGLFVLLAAVSFLAALAISCSNDHSCICCLLAGN